MSSGTASVKGVVYNIQRYNLHDGPGIRTLIFLKGCPLRCPWCANPESQNVEIQDMAGEIVGYEISAGEAVAKAARDKPFFRRSGGGITVSGGEPLMQPQFSAALASEAAKADVHIAIETCSYAPAEVFESVISGYDQLLLDLKIMDEARHREVLGVSNRRILENIERAASLIRNNPAKSAIVRVPVIPGINDDRGNLEETAAFCAASGIGELHLLPYHKLGTGKYEKLGLEYALKGVQPPDKGVLRERAAELEEKHGVAVKVF